MKLKLALLYFVLLFSCAVCANEEGKISTPDREKIAEKIKKLPVSEYPFIERSSVDWLIKPEGYKAAILAGKDGKSVILSNGLVERVFRVFPNLATIDIVNRMTGESMLRAASSEGELVIDGTQWSLGGLDGQPERGYLNLDWLEKMEPLPHSFIVEDFETADKYRAVLMEKGIL